MGPTLAGFLSFIRTVMGITTAQLPDNSPFIAAAYNVALTLVNQALMVIPCVDISQPTIYARAVYNFAGDGLINYAPDPLGAPFVPNSDPPMPFFAYTRKSWNINGFTSGVVNSTGDNSTSVSLTVPEFMNQLSFSDLQRTKTPYGRQYLMFAQEYGPSIWDMS